MKVLKSYFISILAMLPGVLSVTISENASNITLSNTNYKVVLSKSAGAITYMTLNGQNLLGIPDSSTGIGPYMDCVCTPNGFYQPDGKSSTYQTLSGKDSLGVSYGGVIMSNTYTATNQTFQQFWILRDGETGLHMFTRVAYYNTRVPFLRNLQELRTLFRPNGNLWTHLSTNQKQFAPLPSTNANAKKITVQDATWSLAPTPDDAYYQQESTYFTKYTFSDAWRDAKAHGLYSDGRYTSGTTYGAWLVMNTKDTFFDGPLHSDLTVDGIVYNYLVSNHHGNGTPNITHGFDRTFGPQFYYFNTGKNASLSQLRADAEKLASPTWNAAFYDSIAKYIPNYVPTTGRGTFNATIKLPAGASSPIAVLSVSGSRFQDNTVDSKAYQYWADITNGVVSIPRVKAGTYRLTVYADGIFGWYTEDNIIVTAAKTTTKSVTWTAESAGTELWRVGTPDKSSGEYRHGNAPDTTHPLQPSQYRIFWGAYNFVSDFPNGVQYTVGASNPATDLNYIHWSVFGPNYNYASATGGKTISDWSIFFNLTSSQLANTTIATFTVQLAAAKTAAGNTDNFNSTQLYNNVVHTTLINPLDRSLDTGNQSQKVQWTIPYYKSSSCAVRSAVSCYQLETKLTFPTSWLKVGGNEFVLRLPENATDYESAVLPSSIYVQYDALRLEVQ